MPSHWKAERIGSATTTIFAEMSALAVATGSVNLGQGFPDTDGPGVMLEAARRDRERGQPVPTRPGHPAAAAGDRRAQRRHYGLTYDPDTEVLVTTGATEAMAAAILAFVDPGDEVIALEPFYDSYAAVDRAGRAERGWGSGCSGPDFHLDLDELAPRSPRAPRRSCSTPRTTRRARCWTSDELAEIARWRSSTT